MDGISAITQNEIKITGYNNSKPVVYTNLVLNEAVISVNNFSFSIRPANNDGSLNAILQIKKDLLGKAVEIKLSNTGNSSGHIFKGYINEVYSFLGADSYYDFHISGCGKFSKVDELPETHSYYKKKLKDIIDGAFKDTSVKNAVDNNAQTDEQHYIVQSSQSPFAFAASLATRFGEWMFYDGQKLKFGKAPEGDGIALRTDNNEVFNLNIRAKALKPPEALIATDIYKSEALTANKKEAAPSNDLLKAGVDGGDFIEHPGKKTYVPSGFKKDTLESIHKKMQEALVAASVYVTGSSYNTMLSVGSVIKIKESANDSGSKYIITHISHSSPQASSYSNSFTAVPADVKVPPYTNPLLFPKATPQAAIVTDNEDKDDLARIKVKFPWMGDNEKTPWISVVVPHAGKNKGFRFLPEVDDEVIVDFYDNNAETPFVNGAVYTNKNQSGIPKEGNNVKLIGTKTGKRIEINDDQGTLIIADNFENEAKKDIMVLQRGDKDQRLFISSKVDDNNYSNLYFDNEKSLKMGVFSGGTLVTTIQLIKDGSKILLKSKGSIDIEADGDINLTAGNNIKLQAQNEINIEGKAGINIASDMNIKAAAKVNIEVEGTNVELKGKAQTKVEAPMLDLKGSGMANLSGALVKIN